MPRLMYSTWVFMARRNPTFAAIPPAKTLFDPAWAPSTDATGPAWGDTAIGTSRRLHVPRPIWMDYPVQLCHGIIDHHLVATVDLGLAHRLIGARHQALNRFAVPVAWGDAYADGQGPIRSVNRAHGLA